MGRCPRQCGGHLPKVLSPTRWANLARSIKTDASRIGARNAAKVACAQILTILMKDAKLLRRRNALWTLRVPGLLHPIQFRPFSSDAYVIRQVLVEREHTAVADLDDVRFIVDCGANIGCSAAFLLSTYPHAFLVAVEPDPTNFAVLERNLAPYGSRARAIRAAVWPDDGYPLRCSRGTYRDRLDWATTVGLAEAEDADTSAITLGRILAESGAARIDLLKIDIEGSEAPLFDHGFEPWLDRTSNLCIELHGELCENAFERAISSYETSRSESGELTICVGLKRNMRPA